MAKDFSREEIIDKLNEVRDGLNVLGGKLMEKGCATQEVADLRNTAWRKLEKCYKDIEQIITESYYS